MTKHKIAVIGAGAIGLQHVEAARAAEKTRHSDNPGWFVAATRTI